MWKALENADYFENWDCFSASWDELNRKEGGSFNISILFPFFFIIVEKHGIFAPFQELDFILGIAGNKNFVKHNKKFSKTKSFVSEKLIVTL